MKALDLALPHFRRWTDNLAKYGRSQFSSHDAFVKEVQRLQVATDALAKDVGKQKADFDKQAGLLKADERIRWALFFSLPGLALELLRQNDVGKLNKDDARQLIELLFDVGDIYHVKTALRELGEDVFGPSETNWLWGLAAAIEGNHAEAELRWARVAPDQLHDPKNPSTPVPVADVVGISLAKLLGDTAMTMTPGANWPAMDLDQPEKLRIQQTLVHGLQEHAVHALLRGLNALEQGDTAQARVHFLRTKSLSAHHRDMDPRFQAASYYPMARYYANLCAGRQPDLDDDGDAPKK
jgi:hypothetical protein